MVQLVAARRRGPGSETAATDEGAEFTQPTNELVPRGPSRSINRDDHAQFAPKWVAALPQGRYEPECHPLLGRCRPRREGNRCAPGARQRRGRKRSLGLGGETALVPSGHPNRHGPTSTWNAARHGDILSPRFQP
jgi:hypothetical protein